MNQILLSKSVYVTPGLKRKKRFYKIQFILSILIVIILSTYYVRSECEKINNDRQAKEQANSITAATSSDVPKQENDTLVVALNETVEQPEPEPEVEPEPQILDEFNTVYTTRVRYTI